MLLKKVAAAAVARCALNFFFIDVVYRKNATRNPREIGF